MSHNLLCFRNFHEFQQFTIIRFHQIHHIKLLPFVILNFLGWAKNYNHYLHLWEIKKFILLLVQTDWHEETNNRNIFFLSVTSSLLPFVHQNWRIFILNEFSHVVYDFNLIRYEHTDFIHHIINVIDNHFVAQFRWKVTI